MKYAIGAPHEKALTDITSVIHQCNLDAGWWDDLHEVLDVIDLHFPDTVPGHAARQLMQKKVHMWFVMTKIALVHSEVSEMLEGLRKGLMDDKLPHLDAAEVEGADVFIRLADLMGFLSYNMGATVGEKFAFNQERKDHTKESREGDKGKLV